MNENINQEFNELFHSEGKFHVQVEQCTQPEELYEVVRSLASLPLKKKMVTAEDQIRVIKGIIDGQLGSEYFNDITEAYGIRDKVKWFIANMPTREFPVWPDDSGPSKL